MTFTETVFYTLLYAYVALGFGYMAKRVVNQFTGFDLE